MHLTECGAGKHCGQPQRCQVFNVPLIIYMKLNKAAKERYLSKLSVLDNHDPYSYLFKGGDFTEDLAALIYHH